jgi:excisionase family DNA binding protein
VFLVSESREVMNVRQASQYLGISPDTLYRYITEGEIPAFKLGNRWKLRKTILDRWMERGAEAPEILRVLEKEAALCRYSAEKAGSW